MAGLQATHAAALPITAQTPVQLMDDHAPLAQVSSAEPPLSQRLAPLRQTPHALPAQLLEGLLQALAMPH